MVVYVQIGLWSGATLISLTSQRNSGQVPILGADTYLLSGESGSGGAERSADCRRLSYAGSGRWSRCRDSRHLARLR